MLLAVEQGASMKSTAKKFGVSLTSVANWCRNEGVKSKFRKPVYHTDRELTAYIRKMGIVSVSEFKKKFGYYSHSQALKRLRRLEAKGWIIHEVARKKYYRPCQ